MADSQPSIITMTSDDPVEPTIPESLDLYAVADFCLIPIGTSDPSVATYIAKCHQVLQKSGLVFKMHGYGTNLEGPWSAVCQTIQECHQAVHDMGAARVATDIRIGTRTDRAIENGMGNSHKVMRVNEVLEKWSEEGGELTQ